MFLGVHLSERGLTFWATVSTRRASLELRSFSVQPLFRDVVSERGSVSRKYVYALYVLISVIGFIGWWAEMF